jgi:hypothetical protein
LGVEPGVSRDELSVDDIEHCGVAAHLIGNEIESRELLSTVIETCPSTAMKRARWPSGEVPAGGQ